MESILPTGDHRKRPRQHNYVFKKVLYGVKYENITNETRHIALLWSIYIEIVRITHTSKIKKKLHLIRVSVLKLCRPHATKSSLQISMFAWNTYDVYIDIVFWYDASKDCLPCKFWDVYMYSLVKTMSIILDILFFKSSWQDILLFSFSRENSLYSKFLAVLEYEKMFWYLMSTLSNVNKV